jgi:hypothetical protein
MKQNKWLNKEEAYNSKTETIVKIM